MNLREKVFRQLHFYFSDGNLRRDKFLKKLLATEGWLKLEKLLTFPKLNDLLKDLSDEDKNNLLLDIINKSEIIEFSTDKTKIRRKTNYENTSIRELMNRQIYFCPKNYEMKLTVEDVEGIFFNITRVVYVKQRRDGSFFIEFLNSDAALFVSNIKQWENRPIVFDEYELIYFPVWKDYNDKIKICKRPHQVIVNSSKELSEKLIRDTFKNYIIAEMIFRTPFSYFVFFYYPKDALEVSRLKFDNMEVKLFEEWYKH